MTIDKLEDCRIAAIEAIGILRPVSRASWDPLDGMDHDDPAIRYQCLQSLRAITEKDFGIDPADWNASCKPLLTEPRRPTPPITLAAASQKAVASKTILGPNEMALVRWLGQHGPRDNRRAPANSCFELSCRGAMDTHTLELLDFDKVRALVAARAACSLGKAAAPSNRAERRPGRDPRPPGTDNRDGRGARPGLEAPVRRPARHSPSRRGAASRRRARGGRTRRDRRDSARHRQSRPVALARRRAVSAAGGPTPGVGEFSGSRSPSRDASTTGAKCSTPPAAGSRPCGARSAGVKERIQETLRQMLRSPEIKRILRFPNFSMVGHHYVLPVAKDKRGEMQGAVLRTSASNETVYIEPAAIGEQSAQLSFLRTRESKEVRRISGGSPPRSAWWRNRSWARSTPWRSST